MSAREARRSNRSRSLHAGWVVLFAAAAGFSADAPRSAPNDEDTRMQHARGSFEVKLDSQAESKAPGATLGRRTIEKRFTGDLEAQSTGEMLTVLTDVKGSAAYVAVERVTGSLNGRRGSFALVHRGVMANGGQEALITVVPDSGAGELTGLQGKMEIIISDGKHGYEFEYSIVQ